MSTALSLALDETTIDEEPSNKVGPTYFYGLEGTEPSVLDEENLKMELRTISGLNLIRTPENKIETIKQKWSGIVLECSDEELTTKLEDLTDPANPDEIVVLSIEEISESDRPLIQKGASFFWQIGYRDGTKYPRERFSKISFRRLPEWTEDEIESASILAEDYANFFLADPV